MTKPRGAARAQTGLSWTQPSYVANDHSLKCGALVCARFTFWRGAHGPRREMWKRILEFAVTAATLLVAGALLIAGFHLLRIGRH